MLIYQSVLFLITIFRVGCVTTITTAVMEPMKEKNVILSTKHVPQKSLHVKISNVYAVSIDVMAKMIVATILMKLTAVILLETSVKFR